MKVAVSGAFHSPYMAEATEGLATYIQAGHEPSPLLIPVMANMTAAPYPADPRAASDVLANQVSHAVRWVDTLHALQDQGIDTFIEVGPGKTLSGPGQAYVERRSCVFVRDGRAGRSYCRRARIAHRAVTRKE